LCKSFVDGDIIASCNYSKEVDELTKYKDTFNTLHRKLLPGFNSNFKSDDDLKELNSVFFSAEFTELSNIISALLSLDSKVKRLKALQILANNIRSNGNPYKEEFQSLEKVYVLIELINRIIKAIKNTKRDGERTLVVVDSLRTSLEIMYLKERYSAFYMMAINRNEEGRIEELKKRYSEKELIDLKKILKEEYERKDDRQFFKQNVSACIQKSDIHISFISQGEAEDYNEKKLGIYKPGKRKEDIPKIDLDNSSPKFSWEMQVLKYLALIMQPGIVTPSPEERCMQLAYTAKYNSGCISRQVGASITDEHYSLKAIGWNNTPQGHVPCLLRNVNDLLNEENDTEAFTKHEKEDEKLKKSFDDHYRYLIPNAKDKLQGRNVSFCFKTLKNSCEEGKNQVHTRSLHAEESAFLQITKYGGTGILNGKLFTTASPCELCAKKAYQLGIKVIYYIDPYPGISMEHIITAGHRPPEVRLFNGAIGNAYHWLYEPIMPYKNEVSLLLGQNIKDLVTSLKEEKDALSKENERLNSELSKLKKTSS
jgi:deoxycytidylate deaminase